MKMKNKKKNYEGKRRSPTTIIMHDEASVTKRNEKIC